jgi:hypothetical protein
VLRVYSEFTRSKDDAAPSARLVLQGIDGREIAAEPVSVSAIDERRGRIDGRLSLASVSPGAYRLSVHVNDGAPREIGIVVK